jgi:hemoglobin-like flavoprotein
MDIQESLHRILEEKQNVAGLFYPLFLDRHPEARPYFKGVDLQYQAALLRVALIMIERHATHCYRATEMYLQYLGSKHHARGIPEEMFPPFRDALLAALEQFHGPEWGPALALQWRLAIDRAAEVMLQGYRNPLSV